MKKIQVTNDMYQTLDGNAFSNEEIARIHEDKLLDLVKSFVSLVEFNFDPALDKFLDRILVISPNDLSIKKIMDHKSVKRLFNSDGRYFNNIETKELLLPSWKDDDQYTLNDLQFKETEISSFMIIYDIQEEDLFFLDNDLNEVLYNFKGPET